MDFVVLLYLQSRFIKESCTPAPNFNHLTAIGLDCVYVEFQALVIINQITQINLDNFRTNNEIWRLTVPVVAMCEA